MKKYIYTLYASIVVTMLAVIIASAHNLYSADSDISAIADDEQQRVVVDTLVPNFTVRPDSVPVMKVAPLQGKDYTSLDTLNVPQQQSPNASAASRRAGVASQTAFRIDSLVASRSFSFYPSAMQAAPDDQMRMIYVGYYYLYISPVDLEVHIPVEHAPTRYLTMLNFDSDSVVGYKSQKQLSEWVVKFSVARTDGKYDFQLVVSTITGEAELIVLGPDISMRYVGTIGRRDTIHRSRAAQFFQQLGQTNPAATN